MGKEQVKPVSKVGSLLIAVVAVVALVTWMLSGNPEEKQEKTIEKNRVEEARAIPEVRVHRYELENYTPTLSLSGETVASRTVVLRSETSARVIGLKALKGDIVKKGAVIVQLDPGDKGAVIEQAKSLVAKEQIYFDGQQKLVNKGLGSELELATAKNRLEVAKAQLKRAYQDYRKTRVTIPFAGQIVRQEVEIGDFVSVGTPLFTLVDITPVQVQAYITEQELAKIGGQKPSASLKLVTGEEYSGILSYISSVTNDANKSYQIDIDIIGAEAPITLGVSVDIELDLEPVEAIAISPSTLFLNNEGKLALKYVGDNNQVDETLVTIVKVGSDRTWVQGVAIDEKSIIVTGQGYVDIGDKVISIALDQSLSAE